MTNEFKGYFNNFYHCLFGHYMESANQMHCIEPNSVIKDLFFWHGFKCRGRYELKDYI